MKSNSSYLMIDTGCFIGLYSKRDQYHQKIVKLCSQIQDRKWITTWPVITETCHYFVQKKQTQAILLILELYENRLMQIFSLEERHAKRLQELMNKYKELPMDLADASLVLLAEELSTGDIISTDQRDFHAYRWKNRKPFHNLLSF